MKIETKPQTNSELDVAGEPATIEDITLGLELNVELGDSSVQTSRARAVMAGLGEISGLTDRARVMAKLVRQIGRGRDAIFHGTRRSYEILRAGKLICPDRDDCICFSRSPETAAYFANLRMDDGETPAVLVLDRRSLVQTYRLEPFRDDWTEEDRDEREERIAGRDVSFRRHLIGIVQDADVAKVVGQLPPDFYSWSVTKISAFDREALQAGDSLALEGRAKVRDFIVKERNRRTAQTVHDQHRQPDQTGR